MTTVVATHAVGNMDTWLTAIRGRKDLFATFSSSYRFFKHAEKDRVSVVWEGVDLEKMKALLSSEEGKAAKQKDSVIDPIEIYIEIE